MKIMHGVFWFFIGAGLGLFFFISFTFIVFQKYYNNRIFPGISIAEIEFGGKTQNDVKTFFAQKNTRIGKTEMVFIYETRVATVSAEKLNLGYNENLLAEQAYSIGRSKDLLANISLVLQSYLNGINLPASYQYSDEKLQHTLAPIVKNASIEAVDALFKFRNGRVAAFKPSSNGQKVDMEILTRKISLKTPLIVQLEKPQRVLFDIPIKIIKPKVTTDEANNLGIKELIGSGTSLFQHSIPNRIYNITLAATRLNGLLVLPGETFSFGNALGDISSFTGYKQAYIIQDGRTVLGDGGGVCQVSTTFFRALLAAGLPIVERHAHDYRVGYYEQDSPPGFDATVYVPSIDLRFKNDTGNHILIQTELDPTTERLTFSLYGTADGRQVTISKPVITNETQAPAPLYQDDPTLAKGVVRQTDFAAAGATSIFTRKVAKNGKIIINDKFVSNYRPWQAVYLKGTKE
ncbi:MAG: VanW family protein [Candidatus Levybacteria bacterium]|nr:VanW family protein [Candidatus Levybacteria bacterium]